MRPEWGDVERDALAARARETAAALDGGPYGPVAELLVELAEAVTR
jgi:hypothetical protein